MKPWQIKLTSSNTQTMEERLSISKTRAVELHDYLHDLLEDDNFVTTTDTMGVLLAKADNQNEAAYLMFLLGEKSGLTKAHNYLQNHGINIMK